MAVHVAAVFAPLAVTLLLTPVMAAVARRFDIVDRPGPLKPQAAPVPYLGGVAVFAGLAVGVALVRPVLLVPAALALLLGVADDIVDVPPAVRLACEAIMGVTVAAVLPTRPEALLAWLAVAALTVLLINAVNLLDGLDGLASGVCLASTLAFAVELQGEPRTVALAAAAAIGGFLCFNRPPARIYLGDGGAYLLGTVLALLLALAWQPDETRSGSLGALLFVALPVGDATVAVLRRARAKRPLLQGDRGHVYDRLIDRSWSPARATVGCVAAQVCLSAVGVLLARLEPARAGLALMLVAGTLLVGAWAAGLVAPTYRGDPP